MPTAFDNDDNKKQENKHYVGKVEEKAWNNECPKLIPLSELLGAADIFSSLPTVRRFQWAELSDVVAIDAGFGSTVYTAQFDGADYGEESVVVKSPRRDQMNSKDAAAVTRQMMREAILLESIGERHGIVRLRGHGSVPCGQEDEAYFLVLDYLEGGTLDQLLKDLAVRPPPSAFSFLGTSAPSLSMLHMVILRDMAAAINTLHLIQPGSSIIHRDLKPTNMGFQRNGTYTLFDLGLAAVVPGPREGVEDNGEGHVKGIVGSTRYMAPEVALEQSYGRGVDVYSFAMVAYEVTHGEKPFKKLDVDAHLEQVCIGKLRPSLNPKNLPKLGKMLTRDSVGALLQQCWAHDPHLRPCMAQVVARLDSMLASLNPKAVGETVQARAVRASVVAHFLSVDQFAQSPVSVVPRRKSLFF